MPSRELTIHRANAIGPSIRCAVPIVNSHNSLYRQARLWLAVLQQLAACDNQIITTKAAFDRKSDGLTLCHYGSFDLWVFALAYRKRSVFVFHNVTEARYLWRWSPLVAVRAIAASVQLFLLPRRLTWFAVSEFNRTTLLRKGFRDVTVVPCIVPEQSGARKTERASLLFVGRISPSKGVIQLLTWYAAIASATPAPPSLTIVGSRKPLCRYADSFERQFSKMAGRYPIEWHRDQLPYSELRRLYATSWLYLSASRHEGFAIPVMESICAGTPALYVPCGGTESVLDGVGCMQDQEAVPSAVQALLGDDTQRQQLLERQRKFTEGMGSTAVAERLLAALDRFDLAPAERLGTADVDDTEWSDSPIRLP